MREKPKNFIRGSGKEAIPTAYLKRHVKRQVTEIDLTFYKRNISSP